MKTELALLFNDPQGRPRRINVRSNRFRIGRGDDNDLVVADQSLSRRHAVIERVDGKVMISDCGSQNGTFVNQQPVSGAVALRDGDRIVMGSDCCFVVDLKSSSDAASDQAAEGGEGRLRSSAVGARAVFGERFLSTPVLAMAGVVALLIVAAMIAVLSHSGGTGGRRVYQQSESDANENRNSSLADSRDDRGRDDGATEAATSLEQIEKAAAQVMRRVSSDDRPYVFPPNASRALEEIKRRVEQSKASPSLERALASLARNGATVAADARREGIEPYLVIYTALAEVESGKAALDVAAVARQALPRLLALRAMFGTEMADKSLIIVAAYRMGGGTKKSHPLLETMRRVVKNPLVERNVWYLYERGGIDADVYGFVVSFMAAGVIAQNPRQFGIAAAPLVF
jgi:hypothetical protein